MAFALQLNSAWRVSDPFSTVVPAVNSGVRAAPDLIDFKVVMYFLAVEVNRRPSFPNALTVFESSGSEDNIVGVPASSTVVCVIW